MHCEHVLSSYTESLLLGEGKMSGPPARNTASAAPLLPLYANFKHGTPFCKNREIFSLPIVPIGNDAPPHLPSPSVGPISRSFFLVFLNWFSPTPF